MSFIETAMKHKTLLIGGAVVVGGILLISTAGKGSSGTVVATTSQPTDAQVAASRDIAIANLQYGAQQSSDNAALAAQTNAGTIDYQKAQLQAQLSQYAIDADNATQNQQLAMSSALEQIRIASAATSADSLNQLQAGLAKYTLDTQTLQQQNDHDFQLGYAEQSNVTAVQMQTILANVTNTQLAYSRDVSIANMETNRDVTLGVLNGQYNAQIAQINAAVSVNADNNAANIAATSMAYDYQTNADMIGAASQAHYIDSVVSALPSLKKSNRDDVLKSLVTGNYGYSGEPVNKTAGTISAVGGAVANIGSTIAKFL